MELVKGVPITEYCDAHQLTIRDRLGLFVSVCHAVQHAHQKGIIHRDLKPANVLVESHDGRPVPKVIDFGIAKATGEHLTDKSLYTGFTRMIGTPTYMSPEQAGASSLDVDTRSDVYSLGVLLYELLSGTTPFDPETMRNVGFDELRRMIREDESPQPSQRVSTLAAAARSTVSERRRRRQPTALATPPRRPRLGGDEGLEKDRTRRYESASALAADVERYLRGRAGGGLAAVGRGTGCGSTARRHRRLLATAGVIAAVLVAATAVSTWQAILAREAQRQAEQAKGRARYGGRDCPRGKPVPPMGRTPAGRRRKGTG